MSLTEKNLDADASRRQSLKQRIQSRVTSKTHVAKKSKKESKWSFVIEKPPSINKTKEIQNDLLSINKESKNMVIPLQQFIKESIDEQKYAEKTKVSSKLNFICLLHHLNEQDGRIGL